MSAELGSRSAETVSGGDSQKIPSIGGQITLTLGEKVLRKSPRLMKSVELSSAESERINGGRKDTVRRSAGEKIENLRKSPRLIKSTEPVFLTPETSNEAEKQPLKKQKVNKKRSGVDGPCVFTGDPICMDEARKRWPWRYDGPGERIKSGRNLSKEDDEDTLVSGVKCHYSQADIAGSILKLGDCAYVKGQEGKPNYIARLLEFFETREGESYFTAQWFFRAGDTVLKEEAGLDDEKRVFYSELKNDNPLECLVSKVDIVQVDLQVGRKSIPPCDFYYDMKYSIDYSTFSTMAVDSSEDCCNLSSSCVETDQMAGSEGQHHLHCTRNKGNASLLDLYSGCGAMSTGLCFGAQFTGVNLETRWAVDVNESACESLKINHPKTQVRWAGYGPSEDTWESVETLSKCQDRIRDFVREGFKSRILPLPGDVDVICGGPPCQGISGYNRHRNVDAPLDDERNHQIVVFMDIVKFLKPKYVLMENVVDILKFAKGSLGRYALNQLVKMNYQARLGIIAAGCYGLPQFRLRVFLWGAHPREKLPQFPLPTHDVILRGGIPTEFERNTVAYDEDQPRNLENALMLKDAISELPAVTNNESREAMPYGKAPETDFQKFIRASENGWMDSTHRKKKTKRPVLYDHRPLQLNEDDYMRVCQIPKRKGANFRDLPGVIVGDDNTAMWDPTMERVLLPSGKPLVPDYAMQFTGGKSTKPFGRLWWDETVPTVLTRVDPHNQVFIHPEQDRVLTIRECARLQGFPDYYRFCGTIKERYTQIGNAVAVPVSRALGYAFGMAWLKLSGDEPLLTLPSGFFHSKTPHQLSSSHSNIES